MPPKVLKTRKLKKLEIVGLRCAHYFENLGTGEIVQVLCSDEEYDALALPNAGQPSNGLGFRWIKSAREAVFDTEDGNMGPDSYVEIGGKAVVRLAENKLGQGYEVDAAEVKNDKIDVWQ